MDNNTAQLLQQLAAKLGTTADKVWQVLIYQQRLNAIEGIITIIIWVIIGIILWRLHKHFLAETESELNIYDISDAAMPLMVIGLIIYVVLSIVMLLNLIPDILDELINPQFTALKFILNNLP